MPKAGFISLGCPKNLVDSEVMMGILARQGYEFTSRADEAEVLVVNTCSFIAPAQQESVEAILEMAEYKKFGAAKKLIVASADAFPVSSHAQIVNANHVIALPTSETI